MVIIYSRGLESILMGIFIRYTCQLSSKTVFNEYKRHEPQEIAREQSTERPWHATRVGKFRISIYYHPVVGHYLLRRNNYYSHSLSVSINYALNQSSVSSIYLFRGTVFW